MSDDARRVIMTNNPLVARRLSRSYEVSYVPQSYLLLLERIRDVARQGAVILAHPLAGSLRPGSSPYCSVVVELPRGRASVNEDSLRLIESAIGVSRMVSRSSDLRGEGSLEGFQQVDLDHLEGALAAC